MDDTNFQNFKKAVDANSVSEFNNAVEEFFKNTAGTWDQRKHQLAVGFVQLKNKFYNISGLESTRYKNLHVQWMQSDIIDPYFMEELFVHGTYPAWKHLLQHEDSTKHFDSINICRLFHPEGEVCEQPQTLNFLSELMDNHSVVCFTHFIHHDFVRPVFSRPRMDEYITWQTTTPDNHAFFEPLWNLYANQLNTIHPTWIMGLIDAAQERDNSTLLHEIFTDPRFCRWIETSDTFHTALLERPLFSIDLYPGVVKTLPPSHHFALRRSVVINESIRMDPENSACIAFVAQLPSDERIGHFVAAWEWLARTHHNIDIRERRYIVPALECFSDDDITALMQHPWMEQAGTIVRTHPTIQKQLLTTAVGHPGTVGRSKKI